MALASIFIKAPTECLHLWHQAPSSLRGGRDAPMLLPLACLAVFQTSLQASAIEKKIKV